MNSLTLQKLTQRKKVGTKLDKNSPFIKYWVQGYWNITGTCFQHNSKCGAITLQQDCKRSLPKVDIYIYIFCLVENVVP